MEVHKLVVTWETIAEDHGRESRTTLTISLEWVSMPFGSHLSFRTWMEVITDTGLLIGKKLMISLELLKT
jgi:hypothetical protein